MLFAGFKKNREYWMRCQDNVCDLVFIRVEKVPRGQVMWSKNVLCEETKQTVKVYTDGRRKLLKILGSLVTTSLVVPSTIAGAALDASPDLSARLQVVSQEAMRAALWSINLTSMEKSYHNRLALLW